MRPRSCAKALKGTVKEILGTAKSTGCCVEGEDPQDVQQAVSSAPPPKRRLEELARLP